MSKVSEQKLTELEAKVKTSIEAGVNSGTTSFVADKTAE
jgi:hypothetical protein